MGRWLWRSMDGFESAASFSREHDIGEWWNDHCSTFYFSFLFEAFYGRASCLSTMERDELMARCIHDDGLADGMIFPFSVERVDSSRRVCPVRLEFIMVGTSTDDCCCRIHDMVGFYNSADSLAVGFTLDGCGWAS